MSNDHKHKVVVWILLFLLAAQPLMQSVLTPSVFAVESSRTSLLFPEGRSDSNEEEAKEEEEKNPLEDDPQEDSEEEPEQTLYTPLLHLKTETMYHDAFLSGYGDGSFRPDEKVSRAEAAQMLYSLLDETPSDRAELTDLAGDAWYYEAISVLSAYDVIEAEDNAVDPDAKVSREELVSMIACFFPDAAEMSCEYEDVDKEDPAYHDIAKATTLGWIQGYPDGTFRPEDNVTRAEAVKMINRALGRSADQSEVDRSVRIPIFLDLAKTHWAYYDVMEATLPHERVSWLTDEYWMNVDQDALIYPEGFHQSGVDLYYVDSTGHAVADQTVGTLYFGPDGRYTSQDETIDRYVHDVLTKIIQPGMTKEEQLRAAYLYTRDSFSYLRRHYYKIGDTGWTLEEGKTMFTTGKGNCYCYTSVLYYLVRQLGFDATAVSGVVGHRRDPHAWIELTFDDVPYIYDSELEMAYRAKGNYSYNFYHMAYTAVPWPYVK